MNIVILVLNYKTEEHILVALTRHTSLLFYFTKLETDSISQIIRKVSAVNIPVVDTPSDAKQNHN